MIDQPRAMGDGPGQARRGLLALGVALSLLLVAAAVVLGWWEHRSRHDEAARRASLVAQGVERRVNDRLYQLAEELAEYAALEVTGSPGQHPLDTPGLRLAAIRDLVVVHADGSATDVDGRPRPAPVLPAPRLDGLPPGLALLPPRPAATTVGIVWDGTPGKRILAQVDVSWFAQLLQGHALDEGAILSLVHSSQTIYARSEGNGAHVGRSVKGAGMFSPDRASQREGLYRKRSIADGRPTQFLYRHIPGSGLSVVVAVPRSTIAGPAWAFFGFALAAALLLGLLWLGLFQLLRAANQRQQRLLGTLQATMVRLREAQAMAAVGAWEWNLDTGVVYWSAETRRIYGREAPDGFLPIEDALAYLHPDDAPRLRAMADTLMATGEPSSTEFRIRRGDGALRWLHVQAEIRSTDGGRLLHGVQQDITDRALVRERLHLAQSIAKTGDWEWDIASGRILWSDGMYRVYGLEPGTFAPDAESVFTRIHPDDRDVLRAISTRLAETGEPCQAEFRILHPDGSERVISARGTRETGTDGRLLIRSVQQDITELAQARDQLRATEAQYRYLFEHNPLPMWVAARETLRILAVNDAMLRHYGYSRAELLAMTLLDLRPQQDHAALLEAMALPTAQRPRGRVWTHLCRNGARIRMAVSSSDVEWNGIPAWLAAGHDVTEREASEQRFQLVARATSDAVYDLDVASGSLWWSDSFYALFGYAREEVPPTLEAWESLVHPDDLARVNDSLGAALASDASEWEEEYRFRRVDGRYADVIDRGFLQRDAEGTAVRMVGGMLDLTERHQLDADLRLLRRAVEATDNGVLIADARSADYPVVYANPGFESISGYSEAEMLGRNCRVLQGDDRDQPAIEALRLALQQERETRVLLRNYRKDGTLFWNDLQVAPVRDNTGMLTHYVGVLTDVTERQGYEEQLAYRATHDELTGLPNRQLLVDRLQQAALNAGRYGREVAVLFIDLDDFKLLNDSMGHTAGDAALRVVAQRLREQVRDTDTVGRFGGDEFAVVLTEQTDPSGMAAVIARITSAVSAPLDIAGVTHTLTPSIGHCRFPEDGTDAEALLMHADVAMYQAKRLGRNRAVAYRPEFDGAVSQRLQLVARLRDALAGEEFALAFQPIFDGNGRPVAVEALVRWQHPERGLLPPSEFLSVCEESGLIVELGRRVLHEAARHRARLDAAGFASVRIAINVSAIQFDHNLLAEVERVMQAFSLPPGSLELEVTESVIMENPELAIATMTRMAALGVCLSVDDFGTGYSSLSYLKRLPIHRIKIDRSFVQDLARDADDAAICASVIGLAHSLGLAAVAEGVETAEQLAWLRAHGCDEIQGFLLGRPEPFDAMLAALTRKRALATP